MRRAFTSQMVINILKKRDDLAIDNVEEALERALDDGVKTVIIQPTHIMNGTEYHFKIKDTVDKYIDKFENIPIAEPLLISEEEQLYSWVTVLLQKVIWFTPNCKEC